MFKLPETAQEVFDKVYNHLMTQMMRCEDGITCLYRGDDGLKCAAGCLIPDEEYTMNMEEKGWSQLVANGMAPPEHERLISDLQYIHDRKQPHQWREYLSELAGNHGLTVPN